MHFHYVPGIPPFTYCTLRSRLYGIVHFSQIGKLGGRLPSVMFNHSYRVDLINNRSQILYSCNFRKSNTPLRVFDYFHRTISISETSPSFVQVHSCNCNSIIRDCNRRKIIVFPCLRVGGSLSNI